MTLILTKRVQLHHRKQTSWTNVLLISCILTSANFALAQTAPLVPTRQDQLFREVHRLAIPPNVLAYPWMSSLVDYDNDGSLDVILYGHHSSDAFIWRGAKDNAEYLEKGSWVFGVRDPIWLDVDNDGDIDGIGTEGTNISTKLFLNQGNGKFTPSNQPYDIPSNDLPEIAAFLPMPAHIPPAKHPLDAKLTKAYYVDLNNDGKPELIPSVAGRITFQTDSGPKTIYSGYSWVFEQKNGVWTDVTESLGLRNGLEQQFFPEDIDMDGDLDLIDLFAENIYRNDGYTFTKVNTAPIFSGRRPYDGDGEIALIDLDNNGFRDFVFGYDHTSASGTYLNTGDFSFQRLDGNLIRNNRRERKFADLDGDGDIDMVAYNGKEMIVYENVTTNPGIHEKFEGDYFGTQVQVNDSNGKVVFNTQLFQYQTRGMSQVYTNSIHVGGVTGPVQKIINKQAAIDPILDDNAKIPSFVDNLLHIPEFKMDGAVYSANLQFTDSAANTFSLIDYHYVSTLEEDNAKSNNATYMNGALTLPLVRTADNKLYEAELNLVDDTSPLTFILTRTNEVP